jgi:3-oxoacyl-[acyl-carrier protein] reductase
MPSAPPSRVALVTCSTRGLGRAIARRLANDGMAVAVNGVIHDRQASELLSSIRGRGGVAAVFAGDVTNEREVADVMNVVADRLGPIDVLVVNATGPQPEAVLEVMSWSAHLDQLEIFVKSPVLLAQAVVAGMRARERGRIIQIDSEVVDRTPPRRSAYATAKSAQIGLTRSWARELAPFGSR